MIKRLFLMLALALSLATGALAAGTITDFRTDCLVASNGTCQLTQTVTIDFTTPEQTLSIPLGTAPKQASVAGYSGKKVVEDGYTLLQIQNEAGFSGSRTFTVTYTLSNLVSEADEGQTFSLPLLCPKWSYPIERFSFTVTMPKELETVPTFTSGYYGDVIEDYITAVRQGALLRGELDTPLKDHESIQLTLDLPKAYFSGTHSGWSANWLATAFCLLFALLTLGIWALTLRGTPLRVETRAIPPDSVLPCDIPLLLAGGAPNFNMLICHWANLGYLSIMVDAQGHVSLQRHMDMGSERRRLEGKLFAALFARGDRCDGASLHYKNTAKNAESALRRFWARRIYERNSGNVLLMRLSSALCAAVAVFAALSFLLPVLPLRWLLLSLSLPLGALLGGGVQLAARYWYLRSVPHLALGAVCLVAMLALGNLSGTFPLALLAAALGLLTGALTRHGGKWSRAGSRLIGQILGFRRFLLHTSQPQLEARVRREPQYFYQLLPYAEAMGLGADLARRFGELELEPCEWYHEPDLPRTALGFYEKLQETLKTLDFSIRY